MVDFNSRQGWLLNYYAGRVTRTDPVMMEANKTLLGRGSYTYADGDSGLTKKGQVLQFSMKNDGKIG